ncbi:MULTISPECIES: DUF202 domain-containing protein [Mycobacterium]|uniref:DUF202 domain-containing protein n=1 Tax=Mycobacterium gordonae TaxID=1778 RepID=A0A1X1VMG7_MYCGO|nr:MULTISPECIES: DUF202 domain-containing protein [Mycobacterium]MCV7007512.1 DUF202 domain-containing protein [Mycobacterium gordonae]ODR24023.1 hypothetical protein BHQ23_02670 [Mycobacterium gordonae]ORV70241.1 hypothetical protein AWC08_05360 [Mycobacterium gordonae]PJE12204.1 MAG: DUF202 domain-containing protein [Mycobacterium sp.]PJE17721.1 MAG: DUF202 domain-containing protein [Mycobacterium sp.]
MTGPGGPAERTTLAWSRTSFAFLVNGVLLAIKDVHGAGQRLGALLPAGVACVAASATYVIARRRQHTLAQRPLPTPITARRQVYIIGIATLVLTITTAITQLL